MPQVGLSENRHWDAVWSIRYSPGINRSIKMGKEAGLRRERRVQAWQSSSQPSRELWSWYFAPIECPTSSWNTGPLYPCLMRSLNVGCPRKGMHIGKVVLHLRQALKLLTAGGCTLTMPPHSWAASLFLKGDLVSTSPCLPCCSHWKELDLLREGAHSMSRAWKEQSEPGVSCYMRKQGNAPK